MLEIVFTDGRIGAKAVKIFGLPEGSKFNSAALHPDELSLVRKAISQACFSGKKGTFVEVFGAQGKIIVAGLGEKPDALALQELGGSLVKKLFKDCVACYYAESIKGCKLNPEEIAHNVAFGLMIGSYRFDKYFTRKKQEDYPALEQVIFKVKNSAKVSEDFRDFAALGNAVRYGRDLCNEPANYLTPEVFAADIKRLEYLGLEVEILGKKELEEQEFGLLLAVAQGSVLEPKVAVIKWRGKPEQEEFDCGLVGKGVTFDTGGINLKDGKGLLTMKLDMSGAAVCVASLKALALQKASANVVAVVGLVSNDISAQAYRPDDIITSMSGQTVEIINTDAEGRLVLADCLTYIQNRFKTKKLIDIATLTGTTGLVFGGEMGGLYSNNDKLGTELFKSGELSGELVWRMPLSDIFDRRIDSTIADIRNVGNGYGADANNAACFLRRFLKDKNLPWAHLDIAGVNNETKGKPLCPKGATAFGIRLLNKFIRG